MKTRELMAKAARGGKQVMSKAVNISRKAIVFEIPQSINWMFGLGFKIGLFLILKTALILVYLGGNLTFMGWITIACQCAVGITLVSLGAIMQSKEIYETPSRVRFCSSFYLWAAITSFIINMFQSATGGNFFKDPKSINWFVDFFSGIWKGITEIGLSILFVDRILWTIMCFILFLIAYIYINAVFGYVEPAIFSLIRRKNLPE